MADQGRLRVIAGTHRGANLAAPLGRDTRPTAARVREALFSILASVDGLRVLDLYAGSGALAIEALSRGAESAVLIDSSAAAAATIRSNLERLQMTAEVHRRTAVAYLASASAGARQYDLVFVDPPYRLASAFGEELSAALPPVLAPRARVVVESDHRTPLTLDLPLARERRYGDTLIRIYGSR